MGVLIARAWPAFMVLAWFVATGAGAQQERRQYTQGEIVDDVIVIGCRALSADQVRDAMNTKRNRWYNFPSPSRLKRGALELDERLVHRLYERNGYLDALVSVAFEPIEDREGHAVVEVIVSEGSQTRFGAVRFEPPALPIAPSLAVAVSRVRTGDPFDPVIVSRVKMELVSLCANAGRPYAEATSAVASSADHVLDVTFALEPGAEVRNGSVVVAGLRDTRERVVRRELVIRTGVPYRRDDVVASRQRVYETGLFHVVRVDVPNAGDRPVRPDFEVHCVEKPHRFLGGRLEVGEDEDYDKVTRLVGEWGNRNLWGTGRQFRLSAEAGFQVLSEWNTVNARLQAAYTEPWFLGLRTPATARVYWDPPIKDPTLGYTVERVGAGLSWSIALGRRSTLVPWFAYDQVNLPDLPRDRDPEAFRREQGLTNRVRGGLRFRYDTSDDVFIPTRGGVLSGHVGVTGGPLGGDVDYVEGVISTVRYFPWMGWVIAGRVRGGVMEPVGDGYVPRDDRFFLGGASDVRSFRENHLGTLDASGNPVGGLVQALFNIEMRHGLVWRLGYSLFFDAGKLWDTAADFDLSRPEAAAGVGLQFISPAGPIRLDFARRIARKGQRYHLSILYAF